MDKISIQKAKFSYFSGFISATTIIVFFLLFLGYKIGFPKLFNNILDKIFPSRIYLMDRNLYMPEEVLKELKDLHAIISGIDTPLKQEVHNTILVKPDKELGCTLRPNVKISAYVLKVKPDSDLLFYFFPPTLYLPADCKMSDRLKAYIKDQSILNYSYSTDENGFRKNFPQVKSDKKILIVGDSVAFGCGVSDQFTIPSFLQNMVGNKIQVVNGAIAWYGAEDAILVAEKQSMRDRYSCLIYIVCQNDFFDMMPLEKRMRQIKSISERFNGNVIIFLHEYMQYCLQDILLNRGWPKHMIQDTDSLRNRLLQICRELGFIYYDWSEIVDNFQNEQGSIYSKFALYVDQCHLSPLGNRLVAENLFNSIKKLKLCE